MTKRLTDQLADYVECVLRLEERNGYARVTDMALELNVSKPSVSAMVRRHDGFFQVENYRMIRLTVAGRELAQSYRDRHHKIEDFFLLLGLAPATAAQDAEGIEHCLSAEGLEKLVALTHYWRKYPARLRQIHDFSGSQA